MNDTKATGFVLISPAHPSAREMNFHSAGYGGKGCRDMQNSMSNVTKGIIAGVITGAAVGMIAGWPMNNRKRHDLRRNANKALHAVGDLVQNAQYMMH